MYSSQIPFNLQSLRIEHIAYANMDRLAACMMYRFFSLFGEVDEFIMHFKLPEFSEKIEWPDVAEDLAAELEESPLRLRIRNLILDNTPTAVYAFLNASPAIQERCITKLNLVINTSSDHLDAECSRLVEQCGSNVLNMHLDARNRCRTILGIECTELLSLAAFSNLHRFCASLEFPDTPRWVNVNTVQMLHTLSSTLPLVEIVFKVHIVSYDNLKKFSIFRKHGWETLDRFLQCFKQLKWVAFEFEVDIQDPMLYRNGSRMGSWFSEMLPDFGKVILEIINFFEGRSEYPSQSHTVTSDQPIQQTLVEEFKIRSKTTSFGTSSYTSQNQRARNIIVVPMLLDKYLNPSFGNLPR
ncbi:hypothetical protein ABKN59_010729 [Abortiporus biennis]